MEEDLQPEYGPKWSDQRVERMLGALVLAVVALLLALIVVVFIQGWPSFAHNGLSWFGSGGNVDEELSQISACHVSAYPNAGLPNAMGEYDEQPAQTAHFIEEWAANGWVNIVGGCCGTTPDHIRHIADHVSIIKPRSLPVLETELV